MVPARTTAKHHRVTHVPAVSAPWSRWLAGTAAVISAAVCTYATRQADPDLWGYLTFGRLFVEQGHLTDHDVFAYTSAGLHWVTFEYLAHISLWLAYQTQGSIGLIALKCLLGGLTLYWVHAALRIASDDPRIWLPVFAFSAAVVSRYFLFRPQLVTFAFFAYFVAVLFRYLQRGEARLWTLPLVMLVWANLHGGFLAGLGAIGLTMGIAVARAARADAGRAVRAAWPLAATLLACGVVTFANPQGPRLWAYVLTEITHGTNRRYIAEWAPVSLTTGDVWSTVGLAIVVLLLVGAGWSASRRPAAEPTHHPLIWVASCVPIIVLSCLSIRHVPIAIIWTAPVIALLAQAGVEGAAPFLRRAWTAFTAVAAATICLACIVVWVQPRPVIAEGGQVLGATNPCRAVGFLRERRIAGNLFTPLWWGSYVTWNLYPDVRVSMDGRNISLYPDALVTENLRFYSDGPEQVDIDTPLRLPSEFLLVPANMPALVRIEADRRWRRIYRDSDAVVFVRAASAAEERVKAMLSGADGVAPGPCQATLE